MGALHVGADGALHVRASEVCATVLTTRIELLMVSAIRLEHRPIPADRTCLKPKFGRNIGLQAHQSAHDKHGHQVDHSTRRV